MRLSSQFYPSAQTANGMVLGWSLFNIVSDSTALHSKWLLLPKIEISLLVNFCFITNQNELKFELQLHGNE
jgi:hypothetical protein